MLRYRKRVLRRMHEEWPNRYTSDAIESAIEAAVAIAQKAIV